MTRVLASADLVAGEAGDTDLRRVTTPAGEVLVGRLTDGRVVAFASHCPHQLTDLVDATFWDGNVRCPRHNYVYDSGSGENILPRQDCRPENLWKLAPGYLPVFEVHEADGWIWVADEARPPPPSFDPGSETPPAPGASRPAAGAPAAGTPAADAGPVEHPAKSLRVRPGSTFELRLPTTPRPGHVWRIEVTPLLAVVEERFEPGDPPRHRVKLAVRSVGEGTVRCAYARPWETAAAEIRTYAVTAEPL